MGSNALIHCKSKSLRDEQKEMEQKLNDLQSKVIVGGVNLVLISVLEASCSLNVLHFAVGKG